MYAQGKALRLTDLSRSKEAAVVLTAMTHHPDNFIATCAFGTIANISHDPVREALRAVSLRTCVGGEDGASRRQVGTILMLRCAYTDVL